jgi:hypothetical protein
MGLSVASVWHRLRVCLENHQRLVAENKNKREMTRVERRIRHLTHLLEKYDAAGIAGSLIHDGEVDRHE